ncbi:MAG TPA: hypothetical protein VKB88_13340 [Bryobacteraceae bacterium]|nr:hypothetical protein [Bryobacteraceae bacterium]
MRYCLWIVLALGAAWAADMPSHEVLHGKLMVRDGKPAALETADHKVVELDGDESTKKVLADKRLNGFDVEARGHFTAPARFAIDPFHERGLVAVDKGKVRVITYYCDVCNIRTYVPGPCACCQKETTLELRDPSQEQQ